MCGSVSIGVGGSPSCKTRRAHAAVCRKAARRVPRELWPVVYRKLTMLDSAQRLDDLAAVPGNRLEALAGDRKGQHGIRVNQQYRITFRWENHDADDVCCEDYP